MSILLGAIADDFTGATDLANTLVGQGMPTVQAIGVPGADFDPGDAACVVVALKSRTNPAADAIAESLAALEWLQARRAQQIFFKYCSTFDSTDAGNIGPVADALLDKLDSDFTIACPAFPANGRSVYKGNLFVGDELLSESGMKDHPLTPMTDANLVRVLARQTDRQVGLAEWTDVRAGAEALRARFAALAGDGVTHAIVDAITDDDLMVIGEAVANLGLVTGGSGIALGLPENFRRDGLLSGHAEATLPRINGTAAVLAGSCSQATLGQIAEAAAVWPSHDLSPLDFIDEPAHTADRMADRALAWADAQGDGQDGAPPLLIYSSATPETVARVQSALGRNDAGASVEDAMGTIARGLRDRGVRRLVVAGGETSGAVVKALGITGLRIGSEIDPGVPWTETLGGHPMALALKSGNFGAPDFFMKALNMLEPSS